jgi:hypothetical protein
MRRTLRPPAERCGLLLQERVDPGVGMLLLRHQEHIERVGVEGQFGPVTGGNPARLHEQSVIQQRVVRAQVLARPHSPRAQFVAHITRALPISDGGAGRVDVNPLSACVTSFAGPKSCILPIASPKPRMQDRRPPREGAVEEVKKWQRLMRDSGSARYR